MIYYVVKHDGSYLGLLEFNEDEIPNVDELSHQLIDASLKDFLIYEGVSNAGVYGLISDSNNYNI